MYNACLQNNLRRVRLHYESILAFELALKNVLENQINLYTFLIQNFLKMFLRIMHNLRADKKIGPSSIKNLTYSNLDTLWYTEKKITMFDIDILITRFKQQQQQQQYCACSIV